MPKRICSDDEAIQPMKKQINSKSRSRNIHSFSSEKTLQLLYEGAAKLEAHSASNEKEKSVCSSCTKGAFLINCCSYCECCLCSQCINSCYKCHEIFCNSCCFNTYNSNEAVYCYSCYG